VDLVDYIRSLGFRNVEVKNVSLDRIVLEADGWTIVIKREGSRVLVTVFKVNPGLAARIWSYLVKKLCLY